MACDVAELLSCRKKLNNANDWVIHLEQLEEQGGDVKPANGPIGYGGSYQRFRSLLC